MSARKNVVYTLTALISSGVNFVAILLWTRLLSPSEYGHFALVSGLALTINAFLFEWLRFSAMRLTVDKDALDGVNPQKMHSIAFLYGSLVGLLWLVMGSLQAMDISLAGIRAEWWLMVAGFSTFEGLLNLTTALSRMRMRVKAFFLATTARAVISLGIGLYLVTELKWGMAGVVMGVTSAQILIFLLTIMLDRWWHKVRPWSIDSAEMKAILAYGVPLIGVQGIQYMLSVTDRFLISHYLDVEATGHYAVVGDLLQKTLAFIMLLINMVTLPDIIRAHEQKGVEASSKMLARNLTLQWGLGLPAVLGIAILAPGTARLFLGEDFRETAVMLLPWLASATLLRCLQSFWVGATLMVTKATKKMLLPILLTLGAQVILSVILLPAYGMKGAGFSALATTTIGLIMGVIVMTRVFPVIFPWKEMLKITLCAGVMAASLLPLREYEKPLYFLASVAGGGCVYGVSVLLLNVGWLRSRLLTRIKKSLAK